MADADHADPYWASVHGEKSIGVAMTGGVSELRLARQPGV
jgi:hypothetical protein